MVSDFIIDKLHACFLSEEDDSLDTLYLGASSSGLFSMKSSYQVSLCGVFQVWIRCDIKSGN